MLSHARVSATDVATGAVVERVYNFTAAAPFSASVHASDENPEVVEGVEVLVAGRNAAERFDLASLLRACAFTGPAPRPLKTALAAAEKASVAERCKAGELPDGWYYNGGGQLYWFVYAALRYCLHNSLCLRGHSCVECRACDPEQIESAARFGDSTLEPEKLHLLVLKICFRMGNRFAPPLRDGSVYVEYDGTRSKDHPGYKEAAEAFLAEENHFVAEHNAWCTEQRAGLAGVEVVRDNNVPVG